MAKRKSVAKRKSADDANQALVTKIPGRILALLSDVPGTTRRKSRTPDEEARKLISAAAREAAAVSASLALPPGPAGLLTILPDLYLVWKIQAQLIADIAALYGRSAELTRESMIYCLFRHGAAQALRDIAARAGERVVFKKASAAVLQTALKAIGVKVAERAMKKSVGRFVPVIGALAVGGYAYYDTSQVGLTAITVYAPSHPAGAPCDA
jgi:hypothetical protein